MPVIKATERSAPQALIRAYRRLETRASRMADLARAQDWESLIGEEEHYVVAVAELAELEQGLVLDEPARRAKGDILERILAHDLETRSRLLERRGELARRMAVSRRERDLGRSYGAAGGRWHAGKERS